MAEFSLQSFLPTTYHAALEKLVFFNARQAVAHEAIARAVDAYGAPSIVATPAAYAASRCSTSSNANSASTFTGKRRPTHGTPPVTHRRPRTHSARSATIGSTRAARLAGTNAAASPHSRTTRAAIAKDQASSGTTP